MRRLNVLRSLSFKLSRRALETMYFSFIRPILEYGGVLLTNCGSVNAKKLEKVHLQAARIVTGAVQPTQLEQLHKETGWQTLAERRDIHCLCLFYKIVNGLTPSYLSELVPVQPVHSYNLRNMTGIQNLFCRTSRFHESFIPYATTLWNNLSGEVRHSETLIIFKNTLKKNIVKLNQLYYIGPRKDAIQLARLRMNCSTLNKHMFKFGLTNSDRCSCNQGVEDTFHFFFVCPKYTIFRDILQTQVIRYAPFTLHTLLSGAADCSEKENSEIVSSVLQYINDTKRFSK